MNILQICSKPPYPPYDGGSIAMNILTEGLVASGNSVKVLAINTAKHFIDTEKIDSTYRKKTRYESVFINTNIRAVDAFVNLFSTKSYNIERFYSAEFEVRLVQILESEKFDIIQLESLWVTPYLNIIRRHSKAKIVLRSHNVEFVIWERLASNTKNFFKKSYLQLLASRLKKYELALINKYDAIATITEEDQNLFRDHGCQLPMIHIPFGVDLVNYKIDNSSTSNPSVFHIGSMDWMPNLDGIRWVVENVWPQVKERVPHLKLFLAGRNMPQWLKELRIDGIEVIGEVPDAQAFIRSKSIMLVPLFSGGGMRIKIIEGMALGKTIISTEIGAEGIKYENGKEILIANSDKEFADMIVKCALDLSFSEQVGSNARQLIATRYDNSIICLKLVQFYKDLIK